MTRPPSSTRRDAAIVRRRLDHAGLAFESAMLEAQLEREPESIELLTALAETCTRLRRYRRGLDLDRRLVERAPAQPIFRYNLACSLALLGHTEEAGRELLAAVERGYRDFDHLMRDPDLRRLRTSPGFPALRERLQLVAMARNGDGPRTDEPRGEGGPADPELDREDELEALGEG